MGKNIAIIPARGGSKGLPGKNIMDFKGKPLIAWTIEAALMSEYVDNVIVTTDSDEIAETSELYGAEVPFLRPDHLAQDNSKVYDAIEYTLERYRNEKGIEIDSIIILQPTSPLRSSKHIDEAFEKYKEAEYPALISVTESEHPIHWTKVMNENGMLENFFKDVLPTNRQSHKMTFMPNGMIYIYEYKSFIENKGAGFEEVVPYIINREYAVDIDNILDFEYAEFLYEKLTKQ